MTKNTKCPICGGGIPNDVQEGEFPGAISRHPPYDEICSSCGTLEALAQFLSTHPQTQDKLKSES